jgi:hypothetical protein
MLRGARDNTRVEQRARRLSSLPPGAEANSVLSIENARGAVSVTQPRPTVVVTQVSGYLDESLAERLMESLAPILERSQKIALFHDWEQLDNYDSKARRRLTEWVIARRTLMEGGWFLTRSPIVAMGVATAGAATALVGHTLHASLDRREWERLLRVRLESAPLAARDARRV